MPAAPLYTFGHGLSYTEFTLCDLAVDSEISIDGTARISATVTNTGGRPGAVTPQLYIRVNTIGVTRPAQQLAGFARIDIPSGAARRVTFELDAAQLGYTNLCGDFVVEPAQVDLYLGLSADDRRVEGAISVGGSPRPLASAERTFLSRTTVAPLSGH
jgi:beta-glucosidase